MKFGLFFLLECLKITGKPSTLKFFRTFREALIKISKDFMKINFFDPKYFFETFLESASKATLILKKLDVTFDQKKGVY